MQTSKYYLAQNVKNIEVDKTAEVERQAHGQNNSSPFRFRHASKVYVPPWTVLRDPYSCSASGDHQWTSMQASLMELVWRSGKGKEREIKHSSQLAYTLPFHTKSCLQDLWFHKWDCSYSSLDWFSMHKEKIFPQRSVQNLTFLRHCLVKRRPNTYLSMSNTAALLCNSFFFYTWLY